MDMNFCRLCGSALSRQSKKSYKCAGGHTLYTNPLPCSGIFLVTQDNQVILAVRGIEPHKGMLDSFGGFVDEEESLEDAAIRELREELSLQPSDYEPLQYLASGTGHYPYQGETLPVISSFFWTRLKTAQALTPADDVAEIRKLLIQDVPLEQLHDDDIRTGIKALQQLAELGTLDKYKELGHI